MISSKNLSKLPAGILKGQEYQIRGLKPIIIQRLIVLRGE
jgi:hypothetical protein